MKPIISPKELIFLNRNLKRITDSLELAIIWEIMGNEVELYYKNRFVGMVSFLGMVQDCSQISDNENYGEIVFAKNQNKYYINVPLEEKIYLFEKQLVEV